MEVWDSLEAGKGLGLGQDPWYREEKQGGGRRGLVGGCLHSWDQGWWGLYLHRRGSRRQIRELEPVRHDDWFWDFPLGVGRGRHWAMSEDGPPSLSGWEGKLWWHTDVGLGPGSATQQLFDLRWVTSPLWTLSGGVYTHLLHQPGARTRWDKFLL